jgi:hypothetical protein
VRCYDRAGHGRRSQVSTCRARGPNQAQHATIPHQSPNPADRLPRRGPTHHAAWRSFPANRVTAFGAAVGQLNRDRRQALLRHIGPTVTRLQSMVKRAPGRASRTDMTSRAGAADPRRWRAGDGDVGVTTQEVQSSSAATSARSHDRPPVVNSGARAGPGTRPGSARCRQSCPFVCDLPPHRRHDLTYSTARPASQMLAVVQAAGPRSAISLGPSNSAEVIARPVSRQVESWVLAD